LFEINEFEDVRINGGEVLGHEWLLRRVYLFYEDDRKVPIELSGFAVCKKLSYSLDICALPIEGRHDINSG
jgi:hypothetical protein